MRKWNAILHRDWQFRGRIEFYIYGEIDKPIEQGGKTIFMATPINIETKLVEVGRHEPSPAAMIFETETELRAFLQPIVDAAAVFGITAGGQAAEVKAQGEHLKDLRALVFDRLLPDKKAGEQ